MKKISTVQAFSNEIFKEQKLTIGLDLGDRWSFYCVLDEAGKIILEQKVATTPDLSRLSQVRTIEIQGPSRALISAQHGSDRQIGHGTTRLA